MYENIVIIAPYSTFRDLAHKALRNLNIDVYIGDLGQGLDLARHLIKNGKNIIVSRGGTAQLLKKKLEIPIVDIKVNGYDLLRAIEKYKNVDKQISIIGYPSVIKGSKIIANALDMKIKYFPITNEEEVTKVIKTAKEEGTEIIIGDTISVMKAKELNLEYELITSGDEAIMNAVEEAIKLDEELRKEKEKSQRYEIIVDSIKEGILAVNDKEEVVLFNPVAEKIFGIKKENAINRKISSIITNSGIPNILKSGKKEISVLQETKSGIIATNRIPTIVEGDIVGVVATFQDVTEIEKEEQKIRGELFKKGLVAKKTFDDIIGESEEIKKTIKLAKMYSLTDETILINGESGTGKEIFAGAIHNYSNRKTKPFVAINCAAIPMELLESELFGYVEGAFTGARKGGKKGLFELAHKGTIFLDEIGEMDIRIQSRILRVLQEREVIRLGDDRVIPVDVRVIAATNRNLLEEVNNKNFRKDLFYRLNILNIEIPPLRERKDDLPLLIDHFINSKAKQNSYSLNPRIEKLLYEYNWPGNIRELKSVITKICIMDTDSFDDTTINFLGLDLDRVQSSDDILENDFFEGTLKDIERRIIIKILERQDYNKTNTAKILGITRKTLNNKLSKSEYK